MWNQAKRSMEYNQALAVLDRCSFVSLQAFEIVAFKEDLQEVLSAMQTILMRRGQKLTEAENQRM